MSSKKRSRRSSRPQEPKDVKLIPDVDAEGRPISKQKSKFSCPLTWNCALPQPPLMPKLLHVQLPKQRLIRACGWNVELVEPIEIMPEIDTGAPIGLIDMDQYTAPPESKKVGGAVGIGPGGTPLTDEEELAWLLPSDLDIKRQSYTSREQQIKLGMELAAKMPWMTKPKPIQNDLYGHQEDHTSEAQKRDQEWKRVQQQRRHLAAESTLTSELDAIEDSFFANREPPVPPKADLVPLEIYELVPSEDLAKFTTTLVHFDADPSQADPARFRPDLSGDSAGDGESKAKALGELSEGRSVLRSFGGPYLSMYYSSGLVSNQISSEVFTQEEKTMKWVSEFVLQPAPPVAKENNFYLALPPARPGDEEAGPAVGSAFYARYANRINIRKRARTQTDDTLQVKTRPSLLQLTVSDDPLVAIDQENMEKEELDRETAPPEPLEPEPTPAVASSAADSDVPITLRVREGQTEPGPEAEAEEAEEAEGGEED